MTFSRRSTNPSSCRRLPRLRRLKRPAGARSASGLQPSVVAQRDLGSSIASPAVNLREHTIDRFQSAGHLQSIRSRISGLRERPVGMACHDAAPRARPARSGPRDGHPCRRTWPPSPTPARSHRDARAVTDVAEPRSTVPFVCDDARGWNRQRAGTPPGSDSTARHRAPSGHRGTARTRPSPCNTAIVCRVAAGSLSTTTSTALTPRLEPHHRLGRGRAPSDARTATGVPAARTSSAASPTARRTPRRVSMIPV